ncbi:MAG TPA: UTRA domain-containing protein, partial [Anaerolineae bacterium]
ALGLMPGGQVFLLARLRLADEEPMAIETAYLSHTLCPNLIEHDFAVESLNAVLENDYSLRLVQAEQVIEAALAAPDELRLLELTAPAAILRMQRLTFAGPGLQPVEYVISTYRSDRYKFRSTLRNHSDSSPTAAMSPGAAL